MSNPNDKAMLQLLNELEAQIAEETPNRELTEAELLEVSGGGLAGFCDNGMVASH